MRWATRWGPTCSEAASDHSLPAFVTLEFCRIAFCKSQEVQPCKEVQRGAKKDEGGIHGMHTYDACIAT